MQRKHRTLLQILYWVLAVGWIAVLFLLSGQNAEESSELSGWFIGLIRGIFPFNRIPADQMSFVVRKMAHFCIFALEGFLLCIAMTESLRDRSAGAVLTVIVCTALAAGNEIHQMFSEGRSCEGRDMLIDTSGALLGIGAALLLLLLIRKWKQARRKRR